MRISSAHTSPARISERTVQAICVLDWKLNPSFGSGGDDFVFVHGPQ